MNRKLSPEEEVIVKELWRRKCAYEDTLAYVTTTQELELSKWNGRHPVEKNSTIVKIPSGTTLKIVMISRFGDFGLTDDLEAVNGYHTRLPWEDDKITDIRWDRKGKPGPSRYDLLLKQTKSDEDDTGSDTLRLSMDSLATDWSSPEDDIWDKI